MPGPSVLLGKGGIGANDDDEDDADATPLGFCKDVLKETSQRYAVIIRTLLHSDEKDLMTPKAKVWSNSALALYFLLWNSNVLFVCFPVACLAGQV